MHYTATSKYLRISTRKARLVVDAVKKLSPSEAILQLTAMPKRAGKFVSDAIASALANAKVKGVDVSALRFKLIEVMGGPVMKRWHAVSRGQAHGYKKRMTHIRVVLTDEARQVKSKASQK